MCLQCDISVRQYCKGIIIPPASSRHYPDMTLLVKCVENKEMESNACGIISMPYDVSVR